MHACSLCVCTYACIHKRIYVCMLFGLCVMVLWFFGSNCCIQTLTQTYKYTNLHTHTTGRIRIYVCIRTHAASPYTHALSPSLSHAHTHIYIYIHTKMHQRSVIYEQTDLSVLSGFSHVNICACTDCLLAPRGSCRSAGGCQRMGKRT